jgi:hypothetical protein
VTTPDLSRSLRAGCTVVVGTVSSDGEPRAARAWGLTVVEGATGADADPGAPGLVRILVDADDAALQRELAAGRAVAVTTVEPGTMVSLQLKGRVRTVEAADEADLVAAASFRDRLFAAMARGGGSRELLERMVPAGLVACVVAVHDRYDQTPGPGAGAAISRTNR